ncbi:hypothetical protein AgCh_001096 [Apium graveolens]
MKKDREEPTLEGALQSERIMVAAGYCMYRSLCTFVMSTGSRVNGFIFDQSPGEFILTHLDIKSIKASAVENSINGQPLCFVNGCKMNTSINQKGDPCGVKEDRSTQSKPPGKPINGNLVDIAVKKINMDQIESESSLMPF